MEDIAPILDEWTKRAFSFEEKTFSVPDKIAELRDFFAFLRLHYRSLIDWKTGYLMRNRSRLYAELAIEKRTPFRTSAGVLRTWKGPGSDVSYNLDLESALAEAKACKPYIAGTDATIDALHEGKPCESYCGWLDCFICETQGEMWAKKCEERWTAEKKVYLSKKVAREFIEEWAKEWTGLETWQPDIEERYVGTYVTSPGLTPLGALKAWMSRHVWYLTYYSICNCPCRSACRKSDDVFWGLHKVLHGLERNLADAEISLAFIEAFI